MIKIFSYLFFLTTVLCSNQLIVDEKSNNLNITSNIKVYIDHTKTKTFEDIQNILSEFKKHDRNFLDFGYIVASATWVKIELKNNTQNDIQKILEYTDPLVTKYFLYDKLKGKNKRLQGVGYKEPTTQNLNNYFLIDIPAESTKTYYAYITSEYASTHGSLKLWNQKDFFQKESMDMVLLSGFFAAMIVLAIYNLFLFFFSKNKIYLYYILYLSILIWHHGILTGYFYTFLESEQLKYFENDIFTMFIINSLVITSILFTQEFLNTKQYKKINLVLNIFLWIMILSIVLFVISNNFILLEWNINIIYILLLYLLFIGVYLLFKKNFNARYYVVGWGMVLASFLMMTSHHLGIYPFRYEFPFVLEVLFLGEAIVFSVALAHRLKILQVEKQNSKQQIEMKNTLLKEIHHRVKNNMQIIISMIRLQYRKVNDPLFKEKFKEIENRINAMSKVHELLYSRSFLKDIDTQYYFKKLIYDIQNSFDDHYDVEVEVNSPYDLDMDITIYLGLILNELIYNAFKYAFDTKEGYIQISLEKKRKEYIFMIKDNGKGINESNEENSLGLRLVKILVEKQLKGSMKAFQDNGTTFEIRFKSENISSRR